MLPVKESFTVGSNVNLIASVFFVSFFTDINRLAKEDYVPEALDILRVRDRTQGVVERNIKVNDYKYR